MVSIFECNHFLSGLKEDLYRYIEDIQGKAVSHCIYSRKMQIDGEMQRVDEGVVTLC